jgi:hypothetical protein
VNEGHRAGSRRRGANRRNADLQDMAGRALELWGEVGRIWLGAVTRLVPVGGRDPRRSERERRWEEDDEAPRDEEAEALRDDEDERRDRDDRDDEEDELRERDERDDDELDDDELDEAPRRQERDRGRAPHEPQRHRRPSEEARPGALSLMIELSSPEQVEVTLDLRRGGPPGALSVQSLRAIDDDDKPAIRAVELDELQGRPRLRIAVPKDQPPGVYVGAILDRARGEARGTLRVRVLEGAAKAEGKEGKAT